MSRMEILCEAARKSSTEILIAVAKMIGGDTPEHRLVRAATIEVYLEREGEDATDALLDEIFGV